MDEKNKNKTAAEERLENEQSTRFQRELEEKIARDKKSLEGDLLSVELSKDRTEMSEHRTRMSEHRTGLSEHRTDLSETRTDLSFQRTALSYERTLMSWVRTAVSMISFGFTIYKFFEEFQKSNNPEKSLVSPRLLGMIMIGFGFLGLLFAQIQHHIAYKKLKQEYPEIQRSLSSVLSILVLIFGLFLFLVAVFRQ
jgi:inner membrane protein YidH